MPLVFGYLTESTLRALKFLLTSWLVDIFVRVVTCAIQFFSDTALDQNLFEHVVRYSW
jgi:hypothetical protein